MARIRTIKPDFFTSESVCALTPLSRLFFVALWCEADREGRLPWKPKTLKIRYLPLDDVDIEMLGAELIGGGMIEIYTVDGNDYCLIPGFKRHQVINNREAQSDIPERGIPRVKEASARVKEVSTRDLEASTRVQGEGRKEGKEGKGREDAPKRFTPPTVEQVQQYMEDQQAPNANQQAHRFTDHYESNGWMVGGKSKMKCWQAAVRNWLKPKGFKGADDKPPENRPRSKLLTQGW